MLRALPLLLCAVLAWAESFTGTITAVELLRGPGETGDNAELERLATVLEGRIRQAREALPGAGPVTARILREDLGFLQAEQERIVLRGGGDLAVATTTALVSQGRLLLTTDDARLQIDRNRNLALVESAGTVRPVTLAPLPPVATDPGSPGPDAFGRAAVIRQRVVGGRACELTVIDGLPNPWALGLLDGSGEGDLLTVLAAMPGLPVRVTWEDGALTREIRVTGIAAGAVDEKVFVPWGVTNAE